MINIEKARRFANDILEKKLSDSLTYHCHAHTKDVVKQSLIIAAYEGITDPYALTLLETAAWFHDTGFTRVYRNHEENGCIIAREVLPGLGATEKEIEDVCELIMATRIPQNPGDHLGKILCDADLDYLGRKDFDKHSRLLRIEWLNLGVIKDEIEFDPIQIRFLETHSYFTNYSETHRKPGKQKKLASLRAL